MKTSLTLFVIIALTVSVGCKSMAEDRAIENGGTFVPAVTKDGAFPEIVVEFGFVFDGNDENDNTNRYERDVTDLMRTNLKGIIAAEIQVFVFERVSDLTQQELKEELNNGDDGGSLVRSLKAHIAEHEALANVDIRYIHIREE